MNNFSFQILGRVIASLTVFMLLAGCQSKQNIPDSTTLAAPCTYNGIDISHHQGEIDWKKVSADTCLQFVYIKATEGATHCDTRYANNILAARSHDLLVGSYHYFTMGSNPEEQMENFKKMVAKDSQDLIPMIDVELYKNKKGYHIGKYYVKNKKHRAAIVKNLGRLLSLFEKEYGVKPMIYCTPNSYNKLIKDNFEGYKLYVGRYTATDSGVPNTTIWQYSENGTINGISKDCDIAKFTNGTIEDITMPK